MFNFRFLRSQRIRDPFPGVFNSFTREIKTKKFLLSIFLLNLYRCSINPFNILTQKLEFKDKLTWSYATLLVAITISWGRVAPVSVGQQDAGSSSFGSCQFFFGFRIFVFNIDTNTYKAPRRLKATAWTDRIYYFPQASSLGRCLFASVVVWYTIEYIVI